MRLLSIFAIVLIVLPGHAADLKKAADFFMESKDLLTKASQEKSQDKKYAQLLELKKSFDKELKLYRQAKAKDLKPQLAVSRLYYAFEPAFEMTTKKDISKKECDLIKLNVKATDGSGKEEGPSPESAEVLRWLDLLCG